eukprot:TRINITY_DN5684_c2_g1_i1.p1 TRINITY_DN5684_c2_g1~~TRINITY_DN5684_c2_g1_i1.p1  ORF type:complete len:826 (+),score=329.25 TRINITY_DN5684_c2_g1_i1:2991-5468(+)
MVHTQEVSALKKELAKLGRLNQQLHNDALRDAEAYDESGRKQTSTVKALERKLSEAKSETAQLHAKTKRMEHENDEMRQQLNQALVKQKLYDVPVGQQGVTVKQANKINSLDRPPIKPVVLTPSDDEARQTTIIAMLHRKLDASQKIQDEQVQQIQNLTALLDKATVHLAAHEGDAERLCGLIDTPGNTPALQHLNLQVSDLHHELSCTQEELSEERDKVSRYAKQSTDFKIEAEMLRASLEAKNEEAALLTAGLEEQLQLQEAMEHHRQAEVHTVDQKQQTEEVKGPVQEEFAISVSQLVTDKAVLQRQLEILGNELLDARAESGSFLKQLVSLQAKTNSLLKEQTATKDLIPTSPPPQKASCSVQTLETTSHDTSTMTWPTVEARDSTGDENLKLEVALQEVSGDRDELQVKLDAVTMELIALQETHTEAVADKDRLVVTVKDLQQQASDQVMRLREEGDYVQKEQQRVDELSTKLRCTEDEKEHLSREILQASDDFRQMLRENSFVSQQLQEAVAQRDKLQQDMDSIYGQAAEVEYALKAKEEEYGEVLAVYRQLCDEHDALKRKYANLEIEVQRVRDDITLEKRRTQDQLHETCAVQQREQQTAVDLQSANFEIDSLNKKLLGYFNEKNSMQRDLEDTQRRTQGHQSYVESVERKYQECERELILKSNELDHVREQLNQSHAELQMTAHALGEEQRESRRLCDMTAELKKKEASLYNRSEGMRSEMGEWRQSAQEKESKLQSAKHQQQYNEDAIRHLTEKTAQMEMQLGNERAARLKAEDAERVLKETNMSLIRQYEAAQLLVETQDEELRSKKKPEQALF